MSDPDPCEFDDREDNFGKAVAVVNDVTGDSVSASKVCGIVWVEDGETASLLSHRPDSPLLNHDCRGRRRVQAEAIPPS